MVPSGDHLREVDHCGSVLVVKEDVKLVEVAVDEAEATQLDNQVHQLAVECGGVLQVVHMASREG